MADDFRCQVKQIISDFKAAERITGDISVGIVAVAVALWAVVAYVPLRPAAVRYGGCSGADRHRAAAQKVQLVVGDGDAGLLHAVHAESHWQRLQSSVRKVLYICKS